MKNYDETTRSAPSATKARSPADIYVVYHFSDENVGSLGIRKITRALYHFGRQIPYIHRLDECVDYENRSHIVFGIDDLILLNRQFTIWGGSPIGRGSMPELKSEKKFRYIRSWLTVRDAQEFGTHERDYYFRGRTRIRRDLVNFHTPAKKEI
jgi:hypothetical protein